MPQATLHFLCGKMAAGKSTLSRALAKKEDAVLLCEDAWLEQLYPVEIVDISSYLKYSKRLREVVSGHVQSILSRGISVVLDFPANTVEQRRWFRTIFEGSNADHVLHFIDASDDLCKVQLKKRNKEESGNVTLSSEDVFDAITKYFQPPRKGEGFKMVTYKR